MEEGAQLSLFWGPLGQEPGQCLGVGVGVGVQYCPAWTGLDLYWQCCTVCMPDSLLHAVSLACLVVALMHWWLSCLDVSAGRTLKEIASFACITSLSAQKPN